jgi:hypothetical protein
MMHVVSSCVSIAAQCLSLEARVLNPCAVICL